MIEQFGKPLGLVTVFLLTAGTYRLFDFLDRQASTQARRTINEWIKGDWDHWLDVRAAILAAFDGLYSYPLLRFRAFFRSASISTYLTFCYVIWFYGSFHLGTQLFFSQLIVSITLGTIISDYLSLFVVRAWLTKGSDNPILTLLIAPVLGAFIIVFSYSIAFIIHMTYLTNGDFTPTGIASEWNSIKSHPELVNALKILAVAIMKLYFLLGAPALLIHLWLPLMAFGVLLNRLLLLLPRSIMGVQWFLRQGNQHPLRAIGLIAALVVIVTSTIIQLLR